jgi:hypothetical protein
MPSAPVTASTWQEISAGAPVAAVVVALFGPYLFRFLNSPRLRIDYEDGPSFRRHGHPDPMTKWTDEFWIRVRVSYRGWQAAESLPWRIGADDVKDAG